LHQTTIIVGENMKANRLDDIFQVKNGIPIIAGLYIGMEGYEAEEKLEELKEYKSNHSYEYPADLIFQMQIDFACEYFSYSETVRTISIAFSGKGSTRDVNFITKYIKEKYYNERVDEFLQKDSDGEILSYLIDIFNDYYHFTICSKDNGVMSISLIAGSSDYEVYQSINLIVENDEIWDYINQSTLLCDKDATSREKIEEVMPIRYGLPSFMGCFLSDVLLFGTSHGRLSDMTDDAFSGNPMVEDYDIFYEYSTDEQDRIIEIILTLPTESEGLWPIIKYLKQNTIVTSSEFKIEEDDCGTISSVKGYIENDFLSIKISNCSYSCNGDTQITISGRDEVQLFMALRTIFFNEGLIYFINGLHRFYNDEDDTQDAKFNDLRKEYTSFEQFLNDYSGTKASYAHDMGGYSQEEYEKDKEVCISAWNTPGSRRPLSWVDIGPIY